MKKQVTQLTEAQLRDLINKSVNEITITRATPKQADVQQHWLQDYTGQTFKFFVEDRMGLIVHLLFTFEKVTQLDASKTILAGDVVFIDKQISEDCITIDFTKNRVQYRERGNKQAYNLEIDSRFSPLWNKLLEQLQKMANAL